MKTKSKTSSRKQTRRRPLLERLSVSVLRFKRLFGYALTLLALALLLLFSVELGPRILGSIVENLVGAFGAGVFVPLVVMLALGLHLLVGQSLSFRLGPRWNHVIGALVLTCLLFGVLALIRPLGISVGGVSLYNVTAGGGFGLIILSSSGFHGLGSLVSLLVLAIIGIIFLAPRWSLQGLAAVSAGARSLALLAQSGVRALSERQSKRRELGLVEEEIKAASLPGDRSEDDDVVYEVPARRLAARSTQEPATPPTVAPPLRESPLRDGIGLPYGLPSIDLLEKTTRADISKVDARQLIKLIEDKLAEYGVDAKVVEVNQGPAFTQFGIEPGWDVKVREVKERDLDGRIKHDRDGQPIVRLEELSRTRVKVSRITALANDLAMSLAAPTIRIEAPVPGKSMVGIEVPNVSASVVSLRAVMESSQFQRIKAKSKLALALGEGVEGDAMAGDLARMPHLLIAGATGSGKSVCINSIVTSLLMYATPDELRLLMVDPKRVELIPFEGVPHLLCPVVVEMSKVVGVLRWVAKEMDERYKKFAEAGARNIQAFNEKMTKQGRPGLPYIVVIIDELADLMMLAADEVERIICRLAQLARATGIHLVIATQRPSVDVVTGLIKANIPTRISFAVTSQVDSRTILDMAGAEKLLGRGDMLYMPTDAAKPIRIQGTFVSDAEIESLVAWWKTTTPTRYVDELLNLPEWTGEGWDEEDPKLEEARSLVEQGTHVSVSFLQRRLRVGYNRAKRIMERLEDEGLVDESSEEEGFSRFST